MLLGLHHEWRRQWARCGINFFACWYVSFNIIRHVSAFKILQRHKYIFSDSKIYVYVWYELSQICYWILKCGSFCSIGTEKDSRVFVCRFIQAELGGPLTNSLMTKWLMSGVLLYSAKESVLLAKRRRRNWYKMEYATIQDGIRHI